ncbi:uncharacterized protein LOC108740369 isoform X4 [Agrilus planipennis]|uniref:Uncharacterized protein LOC108740369 isoform X4 n=1 Tax=Agrilus planipennis TaxID=224129 RepID=A0A7F5RFW8_AGRPL|nr:uncharacterized protein LOC108740369 isoform X4 [Agrilus planipennis]
MSVRSLHRRVSGPGGYVHHFYNQDGEKTLLITKARSAEQSVIWRDGGGGGCVEGGGGGVGSGGGGADRRGTSARRAPSLRLANGRVAAAQSEEEIRSPPPRRLAKDDSIKISIENTNTCTDSLVTALDDETLLIQKAAVDFNNEVEFLRRIFYPTI